MNRKYKFVIPALLAGLLAACGGHQSDSAEGQAPRLLAARAAATATAATSWNSVRWGGGGYVTGTIYHPVNYQFCGNAVVVGDWTTYGRIYVNGVARGLQYSN